MGQEKLTFRDWSLRLAALWRDPPAVMLLILNLIPAVLAIAFGWSAGLILLIFWAENIVIGGINALKMLISGIAMGTFGAVVAVIATAFFVVHYGFFCLCHGFFVMFFISLENGGIDNIPDPGAAPGTLAAYAFGVEGFKWNLIAIITVQAVLFVTDWLLKRKWRETNPMTQMFEPYPRMAVLHITLIAAGFAFVLLHLSAAGAVLLAIGKTMFELDQRAKQKAGVKAVGSPSALPST